MSDHRLAHPLPTHHQTFNPHHGDQNDTYDTLPSSAYAKVSAVVDIKGIHNSSSNTPAYHAPQYAVAENNASTFNNHYDPSTSSSADPSADRQHPPGSPPLHSMDYSPQMLSHMSSLNLPSYGALNASPDVYAQQRPSHQQHLHAPLPNTPIEPWYLESDAAAASVMADAHSSAAANVALLQAGFHGTLYPPPHAQQTFLGPHVQNHFEPISDSNSGILQPGSAPPQAVGNMAAWGIGMGVSGSLDPSTGVFSRTVEHPRMRTAQACEKCRTRKAKCSGDHPTCQRCLTRGLVCEYAPERKMRGPNKPKTLGAPTTTSARRPGPSSPAGSASSSNSDEGGFARKRANTLPSLVGSDHRCTGSKASPLAKHASIPRGEEIDPQLGGPFSYSGMSEAAPSRPPQNSRSELDNYDWSSRRAKVEYDDSNLLGDPVYTHPQTPHQPPAPPPSTPAGALSYTPRPRSTSVASLRYPSAPGSDESPMTPRSLVDGLPPLSADKDQFALMHVVEMMESEGLQARFSDGVQDRKPSRIMQ